MGGDLSQYVVYQGWVDLSIHTQYPISRISECGAFYRIFFGQEYRIAICEGQVGCAVRVMVGKSVRREEDAQCLQMLEIALRVADTGHGVNFGFVKIIGRFVKIGGSGCLARV